MVITPETLQNNEAEAIVVVPEWAKQWKYQSYWCERYVLLLLAGRLLV